MEHVITKVKDLIALLQGCDPEAVVSLDVPAALTDGDPTDDGVYFGYEPVFDTCFSTEHAEVSDRVYIRIKETDLSEILTQLKSNKSGDQLETSTHEEKSIALNAPVAIAVAVSSDTYQNLVTVVKNCNLSHAERDGATSHGPLDVSGLLTMLAEDVAMTNSRPGSWEGANMQQVLDSHGYQ
jgi:hypothetical protein